MHTSCLGTPRNRDTVEESSYHPYKTLLIYMAVPFPIFSYRQLLTKALRHCTLLYILVGYDIHKIYLLVG